MWICEKLRVAKVISSVVLVRRHLGFMVGEDIVIRSELLLFATSEGDFLAGV